MTTARLPTLQSHSSDDVSKKRPAKPPLVAIAGSHGKSTVAWLVSQIGRRAGATVGSWLSSGVFINDELQPGELGAWRRVLLAGRAGEIDLIIHEMNASTVLGVGLAPDTYQIALINNICGNDLHCQFTETAHREIEAANAILDSLETTGVQIGNADDQTVVDLLEASQRRTILYALHEENPVLTSHLHAGETAAWIADDMIMYGARQEYVALARVDELPATVGGSITFQLQNILAAICVTAALKLPVSSAISVAKQFTPDIFLLPGACNIFQYYGSRIIVDSAGSPWPLKKLVRGMKRQPHRRTLVTTGCLTEMPIDEVREAARIIGSLAGVVLLHGEKQNPERFALMKHGLADNAVPPIVVVVDDEPVAVDRFLNAMSDHDIGLILAEDTKLVIERLYPAPNVSL